MKYLVLVFLLTACCRCPEPYQQPGWKGWRGESEDYWRGYGEGSKAGADAVDYHDYHDYHYIRANFTNDFLPR